ncbi:MAG: hypothetical protein QXF58_05205 [Desulfurococcaceae archaeon]
MVRIRRQVRIVSTTDEWVRYLTLCLTPITDDYKTWPNRTMITRYDVGRLVYDVEQDVSPGTYPVYLGITNDTGTWTVDVYIRDATTGATLFKREGYLKREAVTYGRVVHLGNVTIGSPPSTTTKLTVKCGSGGNVTLTAGGSQHTISSGQTRTFEYNYCPFVTLTASPLSGYVFDRWLRDGSFYGAATTIQLLVDRNTTFEAVFKPVSSPPSGYYNLTYNVGSGGKLVINGVSYTGSGVLTFASGTRLTIKAVPDSGYEIDQFIVAGSAVVGTDTRTITLNSDTSVSVSFKKTTTPSINIPWEQVNETFSKMMNAMISMSMMMAMMQMMIGMMQAMAAGVA